MPKHIRQVGEFLTEYVLRNFHRVSRGFLRIITFETGMETWECMDRGHAVVVLPVDFERKVIYLIEQPRLNVALVDHPETAALLERTLRYGDACAEVKVPADVVHMIDAPAGMIDEEDGADPERAAMNAALRELLEETGFAALLKDLTRVSDHFVSVGGTTERHVCFLADVTGLVPEQPEGDGTELIAVHEYTFQEAYELLMSGGVRTGALGIMLRDFFLRRFTDEIDAARINGTVPSASL